VSALATFVSGAIANITISAELHGYERFSDLVVFGTDGTLAVNWKGGREIALCTDDGAETIPCAEDADGPEEPHFVRQIAEFLASVRDDRPSLTDGKSERATLAAILAGYESIRTGQPVKP
ncbi:hypothetical protein LCGC14_2311380, partial [marine sediment metagenome]